MVQGVFSTKKSIKQKLQHKYLIINGQAKYNLFGHWCFIAPNSVVCLAKIRFFGGNIEFVWLKFITFAVVCEYYTNWHF